MQSRELPWATQDPALRACCLFPAAALPILGARTFTQSSAKFKPLGANEGEKSYTNRICG